MNKIALVTGASSGIGAMTVKELSKSGYTVYAAARRVDKMEELKKDGITPISLDLTKEESMVKCVDTILKEAGRIDVVVVEPGGIKTDWGIIAAKHLKETAKGGAYEQYANKAADGMIKNYSGNMLAKPELIAKTVRKAVTRKRPRTRYLVGFMAKPMVITQKIFGDRVYDWSIKNFS